MTTEGKLISPEQIAVILEVIDDWLQENDYASEHYHHNEFVAKVMALKIELS